MTETECNQLGKTRRGIDNLIVAHTDKLTALKQQKRRRLLQRLFRTLDEATA